MYAELSQERIVRERMKSEGAGIHDEAGFGAGANAAAEAPFDFDHRVANLLLFQFVASGQTA